MVKEGNSIQLHLLVFVYEELNIVTNKINTLNKLTFYTDDFHFLLDPFLRENGLMLFRDLPENH